MKVKTDVTSTSSVPTHPGQISNSCSDSTDYSVVRNHWLNKYLSGTSNGVKRTASTVSQAAVDKIPRLSNYSKSNDSILYVEATANCPACLESVPLIHFNEHLDECLEKPKRKKCIICEHDVLVAEYELHVTKCSEENFDDPQNSVNCISDDMQSKKCTICEKMFSATEYDAHVEKCLLKLYDDMEGAYCDKDIYVDCLTCGKNILKSELNSHLDDCMGLTQVFEDNEPLATEESDGDSNKYNCPFCMVLVSETEMSAHIDSCLNTPSSSSQGEFNKNVLMKSLLEEDF